MNGKICWFTVYLSIDLSFVMQQVIMRKSLHIIPVLGQINTKLQFVLIIAIVLDLCKITEPRNNAVKG